MPTCPRCKVAFLDSEVHVCQRRSRRAVVVCSCVAAIYAVLAYKAGSVFQPGAVAIYMLIVGILAVGHLITNLLHLLAG